MDPDTYRLMRLEMGLSQKQLASRLGIHWQTISKRENGARPIGLEAEIAIDALHRRAREGKE